MARIDRENNLIRIRAFDDPRLKLFTDYNEAQLFHYYEPEAGIFIAESPKVIERAIRAGYEPIAMLVEEKALERDLADFDRELAANHDHLPTFPIFVAQSELLRQLPGYNLLRGAICAFRRKKRPSLVEFAAALPKHARVGVLESVVNPTNVGAIFRSAAALGMDGVLITTDSSDPLYRRSGRVSMGTVFQVPWTYLDQRNWREKGVASLQELGFKTAAMALRDNTVDIDDPVLKEADRLAVILGSEGPGLLPQTIAESDYTIKIPMAEGVDSLNVAAASALAFWEVKKGLD